MRRKMMKMTSEEGKSRKRPHVLRMIVGSNSTDATPHGPIPYPGYLPHPRVNLLFRLLIIKSDLLAICSCGDVPTEGW